MCAFGSNHPGGANFAVADGSVRLMEDAMPLAVLQGWATRGRGRNSASAVILFDSDSADGEFFDGYK